MGARISGIGKALPARILTNADLEKMVETSDEWITERTGIKERRIASEGETTATLGAEAARGALQTAELDPSDVDLVICGTVTPALQFPSTASLIQDMIGARRAGAFDVNAACVGFLSAYATAAGLINSGMYRRILVVGAETLSRIVNWEDRGTCVLFGDGAGAIMLEASERGGPGSVVLRSDGSLERILYARGPATPPSAIDAEGFCIVMDGREVFRVAVRAMEEAARQAISDAGLSLDDIDYVVPHQANARIISSVAKSLGVASDRVIVNLNRYGNTSSASIPLALCEAWEQGRLKPGDNLVLVAFGGGLAWGATVIEWTGLGRPAAQAEPASMATSA
ncbi:MAG TPA: beta-ketoacyl-ACP synthase III [Dehalococcoidia bacterium]|nr:beta-ketoacyl-ACP synthase III [Dehalococcoidia bacterium]